MCGRFLLEIPEKIIQRFSVEELKLDIKDLYPSINITPGQNVPVITQNSVGKNKAELMKWGIKPSWAKTISQMLINARVESILEKPTFSNLISTNRCLIPATGFYEWQQQERIKIPYRIKLKDQDIFAFAGLWTETNNGTNLTPQKTFTIITTPAVGELTNIHDRMPVILSPKQENLWLSTGSNSVSNQLITDLLVSYPARQLIVEEVKKSFS